MQRRSLSKIGGFTVTEALISAAIVIIAMLGVMSVITNSMKANMNVGLDTNFTQISGQLNQILSNRDTCKAALAGQAPNSNSVTVYVNGVGGPTPYIRNNEVTDGWRVTRSFFTLNTNLSGDDRLLTYTIEAAKNTGETMGAATKTKSYLVRARLNPAGTQIIDCWANHDLNYICESMGGTYDSTATPPSCLIKKVNAGSCGANEYLGGFKADGTVDCKQIRVCNPGTFRPCAITNGIGFESCNADGMGWSGACGYQSCNTGFIMTAGVCVDNNGGSYTHHWGQGCNCVGAWRVPNPKTGGYNCPAGFVGKRYLVAVGGCGAGIGGCNLECQINCEACPAGGCSNEGPGDCSGRPPPPPP